MPVPRSKKKPTKSKKAPEGFKSGPQEKRLLDKLASICGLKRHAPKMCEVFMEFVEPYHEILNTEEDFSRLLPVAQAAWNAALLPDPDRKEVIDEAVSRAAFSPKEARRIINDLIVHKESHFSEDKRRIATYQLTMVADNDVHLRVAWTLEE